MTFSFTRSVFFLVQPQYSYGILTVFLHSYNIYIYAIRKKILFRGFKKVVISIFVL